MFKLWWTCFTLCETPDIFFYPVCSICNILLRMSVLSMGSALAEKRCQARLAWQPLIVLGQSTWVQELEKLAARDLVCTQVITDGDNCTIKKLVFHKEMSWDVSTTTEDQFLFSLHNVSEKQNIKSVLFCCCLRCDCVKSWHGGVWVIEVACLALGYPQR